MGEWFFGLMGILVVALIGLVIYACLEESKKPTFELKKHEWECSEYGFETRLQPFSTGKAIILLPVQDKVCMAFKRLKNH